MTLPTLAVGHDAVDERRRSGSSTRPSLPAPIPIGPGGACVHNPIDATSVLYT
jgi:hypothetical protein